jgi:hypothetical protein
MSEELGCTQEQGAESHQCDGGCEPEAPREAHYETLGHDLRADIKRVARRVKRYIQTSKDTTPTSDDGKRQNHSEMIANATLSYRHLEDAAMRIGKAMQGFQGGTSILDKMRDEKVGTKPVLNGSVGEAPLEK